MRSPKTIWNDLSLTRRESLKNGASLIGAIAFALAVAPLFVLIPAIGLGTSLATAYACDGLLAGVFGVPAGIAGLIKLPGLIKEMRHGKDETTWTNAKGQTIKSTLAQQKDLKAAEKIPFSPVVVGGANVVARVASQKMAQHFNSLADKVPVVTDIEGGNNKFRFDPPVLAYK